MSFHKTFGTDKDLENNTGILLDYGPEGCITIHRAGGSNKRFSQVLANKSRPYARQIEAGILDDDVSRRVMAEVYAETVIIGWEGVKDAEEKEMPFTKENCIKLLMDVPELFLNIKNAANDAALFRRAVIEADLGK